MCGRESPAREHDARRAPAAGASARGRERAVRLLPVQRGDHGHSVGDRAPEARGVGRADAARQFVAGVPAVQRADRRPRRGTRPRDAGVRTAFQPAPPSMGGTFRLGKGWGACRATLPSHGLKVVGVDAYVVPPLRRHIVVGEDRGDRAFGHARAAVDAGVGVNVELRIVLGRMDTIDRADGDAACVLHPDARLRDDKRYDPSPPRVVPSATAAPPDATQCPASAGHAASLPAAVGRRALTLQSDPWMGSGPGRTDRITHMSGLICGSGAWERRGVAGRRATMGWGRAKRRGE